MTTIFSPKGPFSDFPQILTGPEGQRKLFKRAEDVPPGWFDPGSKVSAAVAKAAPPAPPAPPSTPAPAAAQAAPGEKKITLTREQVVEALTEANVEFKPTDSLASLYAKLEVVAAQSE